jgi:predicted NodU family carbamoyl transferase
LSIVLGINAYHGDSSACIVVDGKLVAAVEEERFRRIKHWAGFPSESIRYCLAEAGSALSAVDHVAVNSDPRAAFARKVLFAIKRRPDPRLIVDRLRNAGKRHSIQEELDRAFPGGGFRGQVHRIERSSAPSPYRSTASVTSPARPGASVRAAASRRWAACSSRIRSASSTKRSRSSWASRTMVTSTR